MSKRVKQLSAGTDFRYLSRIPQEEWSFLAGLFVGEGCFLIWESKRVPVFGLKLEMTDEQLVREIQARWGGEFLLSGRVGSGTRLRASYAWRVLDGYLAIRLTKMLQPYLRGEKARQATAWLAFAERKLQLSEQRRAERRARYTPAELLEIYQLALVAREYAGGGQKAWREVWSTRMAQFERGTYAA